MVWVRLMGHLFGVTAFAVSTVLAAYMGGLALGAWMIGRRAARVANPARLYAWIEIGIGAFALAIPMLLHWLTPLYGWVWRNYHPSFVTFTLLRFALAAAILLVPTVMMGATLPLLADYFCRGSRSRALPSWLYTLNLVGATLGVLCGGFALLPLAGVRGTIIAGAGLNVGVGLLVLLLAPRERPIAVSERASAAFVSSAGQRPDSILMTAAFLSGLICLAGQVAWTRLAALLIGSTTYAFSTVLLVFLLSLAAGSVWASRQRDMGTRETRDTLAVLNMLAALGLVGSVAAVNWWPAGYWALFDMARPSGLGGIVTLNAIAILALLALPLLFAGTIFPLALKAVTPSGADGAGRAVGLLCAINTVGAILGATLGGFVLVPLIGSQGTLTASAALSALFALVCLAPDWNRRLAWAVCTGGGIIGVGLLATPGWDVKLLNAAIYEPQQGVDPAGKNRKDRVLFHREGPTATVIVLSRPPDTRYLRINGRINASNQMRDIATNVLLAQIPLLLAPRCDDVLVVGLGSGVTAGAALQSEAREVVVVELEPAVVAASRFFDQDSHKPLADRRVRLLEDDARHILAASDQLHDVIISEPSHPWVSGVANLFTQDFFRLAAGRLREDGVFAQWLQTYQIAPETFRAILATFQSVYPEVLIFRSLGSDLILVGSRAPLSLDLADFERRWSNPAVREEMRRIGFPRPESLLAHFVAGPGEVRRMIAGSPINTDDNMLVEFRAPADILKLAGSTTNAIFEAIPATAVESAMRDPDLLLRRPDSLRALVESLNQRRWPAERYERLLAGR